MNKERKNWKGENNPYEVNASDGFDDLSIAKKFN